MNSTSTSQKVRAGWPFTVPGANRHPAAAAATSSARARRAPASRSGSPIAATAPWEPSGSMRTRKLALRTAPRVAGAGSDSARGTHPATISRGGRISSRAPGPVATAGAASGDGAKRSGKLTSARAGLPRSVPGIQRQREMARATSLARATSPSRPGPSIRLTASTGPGEPSSSTQNSKVARPAMGGPEAGAAIRTPRATQPGSTSRGGVEGRASPGRVVAQPAAIRAPARAAAYPALRTGGSLALQAGAPPTIPVWVFANRIDPVRDSQYPARRLRAEHRGSRAIACAVLTGLLASVPTWTRAEEAVQRTASSPAVGGGAEGAYPERGLVYHPSGPGEGKDRWAIGGLWQISPMFTASYSRGLGSGFGVDARLQTIVLYNQLGVGAEWAASWGPFSLGLMLHVDGFFGTLGKALIATTTFDTVGWGILTKPGAMAGLRVAKDSWLTLQYEAYFSPYQATRLGDLTISPDSRLYEGSGLSLIVEYVPATEGVVYYGVSVYKTRANYPIIFNVETSGSTDAFNPNMIWYLGLLAGYEF